MKHGVPARRKRGQPFSDEVKDEIWERDKGICVYCRGRGEEVDHVVPRSKRGPAIRANGVLTCTTCNVTKRNTVLFDWLFVAFFHLLSVGESLEWLDNLWDEKVQQVRKRVQALSPEPEILLDQLPSPVMEITKANCLHCGTSFQITNPPQRFCLPRCKRAWNRSHPRMAVI